MSGASQATRLIEIGSEANLFSDLGGDCFIQPMVHGIQPVFRIESSACREYLGAAYYAETRTGCNRNSIRDALDTLKAKALHEGAKHQVWLRTGAMGDAVILDTGCPRWRGLQIDANGVVELDRHPIKFRRSGKPLVMPSLGASPDVQALFDLLNVAQRDRVLLLAFMLQSLRPTGPYPILVLAGEQGSAKSSAARVIKRFTDPSEVPLRGAPRDERDFLAGASNSWLVAYDNLSGLPDWLSDCLCRLATGGGIAARTLFSDNEETLINVQRPAILNGIDCMPSRGDLAERSLIVELGTITRRLPESALAAKLKAIESKVFAGLLQALSAGLRELPHVRCTHLPRMADFALFAMASESALGFESGTFEREFKRVQATGAVCSIESSPAAEVILDIVQQNGGVLTATSAEILDRIRARTSSSYDTAIPRTAKGVTTLIKRLAPAFRQVGYAVKYGDERVSGSRARAITISKIKPEHVGKWADAGSSGKSFDRAHVPETIEGEL